MENVNIKFNANSGLASSKRCVRELDFESRFFFSSKLPKKKSFRDRIRKKSDYVVDSDIDERESTLNPNSQYNNQFNYDSDANNSVACYAKNEKSFGKKLFSDNNGTYSSSSHYHTQANNNNSSSTSSSNTNKAKSYNAYCFCDTISNSNHSLAIERDFIASENTAKANTNPDSVSTHNNPNNNQTSLKKKKNSNDISDKSPTHTHNKKEENDEASIIKKSSTTASLTMNSNRRCEIYKRTPIESLSAPLARSTGTSICSALSN